MIDPNPVQVLAAWMIAQGFATGHGDNLGDLLGELAWQIEEIRAARDEWEHQADRAYNGAIG